MSSKPNYFKIGIFVLTSIALGVACVIILGVGTLLQRKVVVETYFEDSVQGLDVGSQVKFRGVQIGTVDLISLVAKQYRSNSLLIVVRCSLFADMLPSTMEDMIDGDLLNEINQGLRMKLAFKGITGTAYAELDYLDPRLNPIIKTDWLPKYPYIPSAPSTITRVSDAIDSIMRSLQQINFVGITKGIDKTITMISQLLEQTKVANISEQAGMLLAELRQTNSQISYVFQKERIDEIMDSTKLSVTGVRRIIENSEKPINDLMTSLTKASNNITLLSKKLEVIADDLPQASNQLNRTFRRLDTVLYSHQQDIEKTMDNIRLISDNLKELTDNAKKYPSHFLFGEPPSQSSLGTR